MTWANFYLLCFSLGFAFSLLSFLAGGLHWHMPHSLGAHGHAGHAHAGHVAARFPRTRALFLSSKKQIPHPSKKPPACRARSSKIHLILLSIKLVIR